MSDTSEPWDQWEVFVEYTPGIGWQYVIVNQGVACGVFGNYETEQEALTAGCAAVPQGGSTVRT